MGCVEFVFVYLSGIIEIEVGIYLVIGDVIEFELFICVDGLIGLVLIVKEVIVFDCFYCIDGDEFLYLL